MSVSARARADAHIIELLQNRVREHLAQGASPTSLAPLTLSAFWPIGDEPDLRPAFALWTEEPRLRLALPIIQTRAAPLVFHEWRPDVVMEPGAYGIPEPRGTEALLPDIVLVPTLGFTVDGDRIGYGGGFYDRTLAAMRERAHPVLAWGVCYGCGRLAPDVHMPEPHDMRLDAIVSEEGWEVGPPER